MEAIGIGVGVEHNLDVPKVSHFHSSIKDDVDLDWTYLS